MAQTQHQCNGFENFYLARQPIFSGTGEVFGYELLFRDNADAVSALINDADLATVCVATCGFICSQKDIESSQRVFINFTDNLILEGAPRALPASSVVLELMEDSLLSEELYTALLQLKEEGYLIAIDDYRGDEMFARFINIADIVKVDVLGMEQDRLVEISRFLSRKEAKLLAEKVETVAEHKTLLKLGFDLFQGYYFSKPEFLSGRKISSSQSTRLNILKEMEDPDFCLERCVEILKHEVSLSYRLLRLLNSAAFSFASEIKSIEQATALLGLKKITHWLRLAVISDMGSNVYSGELCQTSIARAIFLEQLAREAGLGQAQPEEMFLFGLFSLLDALLEIPMQEIMQHLPLPEALKLGYTAEQTLHGSLLSLIRNLEQGKWGDVTDLSLALHLDQDLVDQYYYVALIDSLALGKGLQ